MVRRTLARVVGRRRLAALLAAALTALGAFTVQSTFASGVLGDLVPGARVTGVTAKVDKTTTLFTTDLHFSLSGVDCSATPGAELHWRIKTTGIGANTGSRGSNTGKSVVCPAGATGAVTDYVLTRPMFGPGWLDVLPNEVLYIWGVVRQPGDLVDGAPDQVDFTGNGDWNPQYDVRMPKQPVWVGVGDGYSSAVDQLIPTCALTNPVDPLCVNLNNPLASWVKSAVDAVNSKFLVRTAWKIQYLDLANSTTSAADLTSDSYGQIQTMISQLAARAPQPGQPGSWNWVGVTAGLVDAGVPTAMQNWYAANGGPTSAKSPWEVTAGRPDLCPVLPVLSAPTAATIKAGLLNVVNQAIGADPNVRIVHPIYPYWAASQPTSGYTDPCRPSVKLTVDAIATAGSLFGTPGVVEVDMRPGFDPYPTGTGIGTSRTGSLIQLAKPYGFPYPNANGAAKAANVIVAAIAPQRPYITGWPSRDPDVSFAEGLHAGEQWYNDPVDVLWIGNDPNFGTATDLPPTPVTTEGHLLAQSPPYCTTSPAGDEICALPAQPIEIFTDFTAPLMDVNVSGNGQNGWYNGTAPIVVHWDWDQDAPGPAHDASGVVSGIDDVTKPDDVPIAVSGAGQSFTNVLGTACDIAGNCKSWPITVNVDLLKPTLSHTIAPVTPDSGWYKAGTTGVTVTWTGADQPNLSGLGTGAIPAPRLITAEGITTVGPTTLCDRAGNCTTEPAFDVMIDRTAPTVGLTINGVPVVNGNTYNLASTPNIQCTATDPGLQASGLAAPCQAIQMGATPKPGGGIELRYDVVATDVAGNQTRTSFTFTITGVVLLPPKVVATVTPAAPNGANGWYTSPITIGWTPVRGSPGAELVTTSLPSSSVSTDGHNISVTSPDVYDKAGLHATPVTLTFDLDQVAPAIAPFAGVTPGAVYTAAQAPTLPSACVATDATSGVDTCVLNVTSTALAAFGPPGAIYTATAVATDHAGNQSTRTASWTVYAFNPSTGPGRVTGGTAHTDSRTSYGSVSASFTLRCNGSPNHMNVSWSNKSFTMTKINTIPTTTASSSTGYAIWCWNGSNQQGQPSAPIDSIYVQGEGTMNNGKAATIEFTLVDKGEPGTRDTASFVVRDKLTGTEVLRSAAVISSGNVQAHESQGNGTNNNQLPNGPNGNNPSTTTTTALTQTTTKKKK